MDPMLGGKVEEGQQGLAIFRQAFDRFFVFGGVFKRKAIDGLFRGRPIRRHPYLAQPLFHARLHRFGRLVQHVRSLVNPAALAARGRPNLVERFPKAKRAIACRQLGSARKAALLEIDEQFAPTLRG
jgi:hypothetical protein